MFTSSIFLLRLNRMSYAKRHNSGYAKPNRRVLRFHARRSSHARDIDEGVRAPLAKIESQWMNAPNRYDIKGVDAPFADEKAKAEQEKRLKEAMNPMKHGQSRLEAVLATRRRYGNSHR
jgi:hypothetical protein